MPYILFSGGVRSGKSKLAQSWAEAAAPEQLFLATCHASDNEMASRIEAHKKARGASWQTIEEPLEPLGALKLFLNNHSDFQGSFLLDSMGMWINNLMCQNVPGQLILRKINTFAKAMSEIMLPAAIVTEECGLGIIPANAVARKFVDLLGLANQIMAKNAHSVLWVSCGQPLAIKGSLPAFMQK